MTENLRIIRKPEVKELTGLPDSTLYHYISQGAFPAPIKLGPRSSGWLLSDVNKWIEKKLKERKTINRRIGNEREENA